jgi:hypothetical protein
MLDEIREEIRKMEESAARLQSLAQDNRAIQKNTEIIQIYLNLLKFITPAV